MSLFSLNNGHVTQSYEFQQTQIFQKRTEVICMDGEPQNDHRSSVILRTQWSSMKVEVIKTTVKKKN